MFLGTIGIRSDSSALQIQVLRGHGYAEETLFHLLVRLDPQNPAFQRALALLSAHPIPPDSLSSFTGGFLDGPTPLGLAIERGNRVMAKWLVDNGADVNFHRPGVGGLAQYSWPMMVAAGVDDSYFLKLLLDRGACIDCEHEPMISISYKRGKMTPLHLAASLGRFEHVTLLVYHGANLWWGDDFGDPRRRRTVHRAVMKASCVRWKTVGALKDALARVERTVEEGLRRWRLLILRGMSGFRSPRLPDHLLQHVFELAGLFSFPPLPEDQERLTKTIQYLQSRSQFT
jgi:hypothetical protein